ncbi:hypothetical protein [Streptomyces sp. NBC_01276]|uniref:hypothetical protein n=1 Tax=Streptomyces sp. NBC_01276 TaxID=2903808 RepID=UPI00352BD5A5
MPAETVPDTDIQYHLIAFDARGCERAEADGAYSPAVLKLAAARQPTDVFVFSHGWNADVPGARKQYSRWIATMESCTQDRAALAARPGGYRPLLVGLHWPSKAWSDEELLDQPGGSYAVSVDAERSGIEGEESSDGTEWYVDHYATLLADTPPTRKALRTILRSALMDAAPEILPEPVRQAYAVIDAETGAGSDGAGAAPGEDRKPFDAEATYQACRLEEEVAAFGGPSLGGLLAPLRTLTFWQMKRRARAFGENGAATLLSDLRRAAPDARFHLMGHSFGCIVVCAAVGRAAEDQAARPVDTLVLVQGAMSLWSLCSSIPSRPGRPGYFHRILADRLVSGPVLATTSVHDRAVRVFYPLGAGAADQVDFEAGELPTYGGIGTFGLRGPGIGLTDGDLGPADTLYDFQPHGVYDLDANDVIKSGGGFSGAHSDICHPPVAHAIWQAVATGGHSDCPRSCVYWPDQYNNPNNAAG